MTPQTFINTYDNQHVPDNGGNYPGECVSLVKRFAQEVQRVTDADSVLYVPFDKAKNMYLLFTPAMAKYYDRIPPSSPRKPGDILVLDGVNGDVSIVLDTANDVFGQLGTPVFKPAQIRNETTAALGYLRLKGEDMADIFNGGDAQNKIDNLLGGGGLSFTAALEKFIRGQVDGTRTYKQADENIMGSAEWREFQFVNGGDTKNLAKDSGWPEEPGVIGWLHKRWVYDYIMNKVKKG